MNSILNLTIMEEKYFTIIGTIILIVLGIIWLRAALNSMD